MKGSDHVADLRLMIDDTKQPYLWEEPELLKALVEAERQACRRSPILKDKSTAKDLDNLPLCQLALIEGQGVYSISPKILYINRIKIQGVPIPLEKKEIVELDETIYNWEAKEGVPAYYLTENKNELIVYPKPDQDYIADLTVTRLPLKDFGLNDEPEIDPQYQDGLRYWAAHLAYLKNDSETYNKELSQLNSNMFTELFGELPSATRQIDKRAMTHTSTMRPRRDFGI